MWVSGSRYYRAGAQCVYTHTHKWRKRRRLPQRRRCCHHCCPCALGDRWIVGRSKQASVRSSIRPTDILRYSPQCAPSIFNLDQKFHGLSCFWGIDIHETQSRKPSVIRLPNFNTVNMARQWNQRASFSTENLFFEDYSFGSLMTDVFLDWFRTTSCISMP